jgi:hypothetical protein
LSHGSFGLWATLLLASRTRQICLNTPSRKVTRDLHEDARDHARALIGTLEFDSRAIDSIYSATVLGFFWSATMKTRIFARLSMLGFRDVE